MMNEIQYLGSKKELQARLGCIQGKVQQSLECEVSGATKWEGQNEPVSARGAAILPVPPGDSELECGPP